MLAKYSRSKVIKLIIAVIAGIAILGLSSCASRKRVAYSKPVVKQPHVWHPGDEVNIGSAIASPPHTAGRPDSSDSAKPQDKQLRPPCGETSAPSLPQQSAGKAGEGVVNSDMKDSGRDEVRGPARTDPL
jgi:hypothetical protein